MTISPQSILLVIGCSVSIATAIFWGAFYLGEYRQQLRALRDEFDRHCQDFNVHLDRRYHSERP